MSSKLPGLVNPSDVYTEDVLKCIKDTLKQKSGEFTCKYDGSRASARNDESYVTEITDESRAWREKFNRRKRNLHYGFFADKAKPYQTLGKVYLESGELILTSLTDDLRCKITRFPMKSNVKWKKTTRTKKGTPQLKSMGGDRIVEKADPIEATAGFAAIKQRLNEVHLMRKGVHANQSLSGYLFRKQEQALEEADKKDDMAMKAPPKNQWKIVRAVGKIMGAVRGKDSPQPMPVLARAFRKKGTKQKFSNAGIGTELEDLEDKEEKLLKWRQEKKRLYLQHKLQAMNSILCCLYNMKSKMLKLQHPLPGKLVLDLFRQDITLDHYGKPMSYRGALVTDDASIYSDGSNTPETGDRPQKPISASSNMTTALERKRMSSVAFSNSPRRPRLAQLATKFASKTTSDSPTPRVDTWEELLAAGERSKKTSALRSGGAGGGKYSKSSSRRSGASSTPAGASNESYQQWTLIAHTEKIIEERRKIAMLGSISKRTAENVLNDIRHDFVKLQKKLSKDVDDDLIKRKGEQFKLIQNKFGTISLGPVTSVALEKMRSDAYVLTRDRKDNTTQPMPWFIDLKEEVRGETALKDETINCIFRKVARFQYEDGKNIPFGKEKLCLLVMSMPAHMLMNASMIHALLFVLAKVLESAPELLEFWLSARKLSNIRRVETSATPRSPNYL
ncbi:uncharacterized protein LOC120340573 isoform X1 [Styela clava]